MNDTPVTATKAHFAGISGSVGVLILYGIARLTGIVEPPDISAMTEAVTTLAMAIGSGLVAWVGTYLAPANQPKA